MGKVVPFPKNAIKLDSASKSLESQFDPSLNESEVEADKVVDVTNLLREQGAQDRRKAKRVVLGHLMASHVVLPQIGLAQVVIRDIDEGGLAFEMDSFLGAFQKGDELEMRFYLNGQTYFRVNVIVAYSAIDEEHGVSRHGVKFLPDSLNQEALHHFIQFLRTVSVSLKTDRGERVVSNLTS
jgi:hypothetical protein